jgi:glycosyltransferase involved in cell wall biosynthesis
VRLVVYVETDIIGGAEIVTGHLVEALRPEIEVVAMGPSARVVEYLAGRRAGSVAVVTPPMRSSRELTAFRAHRRLLTSLAPAVFHAVITFPNACSWPLVAARGVRGIRPVAVEHLHPVPLTRRGLAAKRRAVKGLAAHVAVSDYLARAVEHEYSLPPRSIMTIPNGVPDPTVEPEVLDARGVTVGTVRRFEPSKGLDVLVRAVVDVPGVTLYLVGEGEQADELRALAEETGVGDRTRFVEWSDRARSFLAAFDIVAVPSRAEAFGLIALEGMLSRRPVVACAVGGLPEVVDDGVTGMLVPPDDVDALADALRTLADDAALRARMGDAGRRRALDRFSLEAMTRSYESLYDDLVGRDAA